MIDIAPCLMESVAKSTAVALLGVDEAPAVELRTIAGRLRLDAKAYHSIVELQQALAVRTPSVVVAHDAPRRSLSAAFLDVARQLDLDTATITVTSSGDAETIITAMRLGATDVIVWPATRDRIGCALERGIEGYRQRTNDRQVVLRYRRQFLLLNHEERQLLPLLCDGLANKAIAGRLDISVRTVEHRRSRIFEKFDVGSAAALASHVTRANCWDEFLSRRNQRYM